MISLVQKYLLKAGLFLLFVCALIVGKEAVWYKASNDLEIYKPNIAFKFDPNSVRKTIKYAGFFSWFDQKSSTESLRFKDAKIAPNGNGIFSGIARPGNSVFLKDHEDEVGFAKSDPAGQWVAIVEKPLSNGSKTYSLHSQSPDGQVKSVSAQKLEIEIPEDIALGARIKVLETGKQPIVLAQNLTIPQSAIMPSALMPTALTSQAMAADKKSTSSPQPKMVVLKTDYQEQDMGGGKLKLSGTSEKNASLTIFMNNDKLGTTTADKNGRWALSKDYELKQGAGNTVRVEQRDKNNKVLSVVSSKYDHKADDNEIDLVTNANPKGDDADASPSPDANKEKTFWQKVTSFFSSSDSEGEKKPKGQQAADEQNVVDTSNSQKADDLAQKAKDLARSGLASAQMPKPKPNKNVNVAANKVKQNSDQKTGSYFAKEEALQQRKRQKEKSPFSNESTQTGTSDQTSSRSQSRQKRKTKGRKAGQSSYRARKYVRKKRRGRVAKVRKRGRKKVRRASNSRYSARKHTRKKRARSRRFARLRRQISLRKRRSRKRKRANRRYFAKGAMRSAYSRRRNLKRRANRRRWKKRRNLRRKKATWSRRRIAAIRRKRKIRVRRGDTLWDIARIRYGHGRHYRKIYRANKRRLSNPNRLSPNQRLFLPA